MQCGGGQNNDLRQSLVVWETGNPGTTENEDKRVCCGIICGGARHGFLRKTPWGRPKRGSHWRAQVEL